MSASGIVHLVVPCSRESGRIGNFLPELCAKLDALGGCRVLVVEDGSGAAEQRRMTEMVSAWQAQHPVLCDLLMLPENIGKGGAVYEGWARHEGAEWLAFVDADGSISADEVCRLIRLARERGTDRGAIIASRVLMLGRDVRRRFYRHLIGRMYATLVSEILHIPVYDSQCGCKLVPRLDYEAIAPRLTTRGFAFDVELLVALVDSGFPVREEAVDWHEVPGGKVRLLHDSILMFLDVLRIRKQRKEHAMGLRR
ncbi:MAG: glycosyltransferase [Verrucomicrobia bacterium]|nr:glycosyltransferase [Verrucomicrobiota bacterium]